MIRALALLLAAALAMVMLVGCGGSPPSSALKTEYVVALQCGAQCPWLPADADWGEAAVFDDAELARAQALAYLQQGVDYENANGAIRPDELGLYEGAIQWEVTLWSPGGDQDFVLDDYVKPPGKFDVLLHTVKVDVP